MSEVPVVVVGAGLAGLACAWHLHQAGVPVRVLEASDGPGGRVRSDHVDGFVLDRGFQVYLTAYPEGMSVLDYDALDFAAFAPGAMVRTDGGFYEVSDPLRAPSRLFSTLQAPIGTAADKLRIAALALNARRGSVDDDLEAEDITTLAYLRSHGFSNRIIDGFFRPLFGGVLLDQELATSSRMFRFVWRMMATGQSVVPRAGMQAIPEQLAARLPGGAISYHTPVAAVSSEEVTTEDGERVAGRAVVVAVEGPAAAGLLDLPDPGSRHVSCVYFAADRAPFTEPMLVLNGDGPEDGPVNNLAVMTNVSVSYGPPGRSLIAAASLEDGDDLVERVRLQLSSWYGSEAERWRHLRTYRIPHAQPVQEPPFEPRRVDRQAGVFVAGDHRTTASINGALESGRLAAESVIAAS
jgi:phytoene dehydrogenase-like protein